MSSWIFKSALAAGISLYSVSGRAQTSSPFTVENISVSYTKPVSDEGEELLIERSRNENGHLNGPARMRLIRKDKDGRPDTLLLMKGHYVDDFLTDTLWTWYANGNPKAVIPFAKNGREGDGLEFDGTDGTAAGEIEYGIPHGKEIIYTDNGKVDSEKEFQHGLEHGVSRHYYPNGKLESETTYENGKKHGPEIIYYKSGQIQTEHVYVNGVLHGREYSCERNGSALSEKWYDTGSVVRETNWFPNGNLKSIFHYNNQAQSGQMSSYFEDGKPESLKAYSYSPFAMTETSWHKSGAIRECRFYLERFGKVKATEWHETGGRKAEAYYNTDNKLDSIYITWFPTGRKTSEGQYKNGEKVGIWKFWDDKGKQTIRDYDRQPEATYAVEQEQEVGTEAGIQPYGGARKKKKSIPGPRMEYPGGWQQLQKDYSNWLNTTEGKIMKGVKQISLILDINEKGEVHGIRFNEKTINKKQQEALQAFFSPRRFSTAATTLKPHWEVTLRLD